MSYLPEKQLSLIILDQVFLSLYSYTTSCCLPHRIMSSYVIDCLPPPTVWSINCLLLPMNVLQHVFRPYIDGLPTVVAYACIHSTVYVYLLIYNTIVWLGVPLPIDSLPIVSPYLLISLYLLLMFYPLSFLTYT
jgi:hypothetical protein